MTELPLTKQIILIGGMPTAGKSTMAKSLSNHLDLPWLSTDQIGTILRSVATRDQSPTLFAWEDYDGMNYLSEYTADEIADREFAKGEAVWAGVRKLVNEDYSWHDGFILEGDDILPELVARDFADASNVKAVFIGDCDLERVRTVVLTRNFAGCDASDYPDSVKEKEVDWILNYGEKLRRQVLKNKMRWVLVDKSENDLRKVLNALDLN